MRDVTQENFGYLIAYVIPGALVLWGLRPFVPEIDAWFGASADGQPTIGGFLYITLASVGAGLFVSTLRWLLLDSLHHMTGIESPRWNFADLQGHIDAFRLLVEIHYRYFQFHGNTLLAVLFLHVVWQFDGSKTSTELMGNASLVVVEIILFLGSRDTLRKYYRRVAALQRKKNR